LESDIKKRGKNFQQGKLEEKKRNAKKKRRKSQGQSMGVIFTIVYVVVCVNSICRNLESLLEVDIDPPRS